MWLFSLNPLGPVTVMSPAPTVDGLTATLSVKTTSTVARYRPAWVRLEAWSCGVGGVASAGGDVLSSTDTAALGCARATSSLPLASKSATAAAMGALAVGNCPI